MMDLKNAVAICLITLFSASLVLLIARVLDVQAASRIEPQLARIVDELEAIRKQGGISTRQSMSMTSEAARDNLVVYYFYGNTRCPTCRAIESQSYETVHTEFVEQLESGELVWKTLNYEQPDTKQLRTKFEIQMPIVVLARMKDGQIDEWNRLDRVWGIVKDKTAFREYVRDEIKKMLTSEDEAAEIPIPEL
jgi:thiol-disulfide isomerase/thioredoxin